MDDDESIEVFRPGPPASAWMEVFTIFRVLRVAHTLVKLGVPDVLARGPIDVQSLSETVGANAAAVERVLRAARFAGIVASDTEQRYLLTPIGELLRTDVPGSVAGTVCEAIDAKRIPHDGLLYATKTGKSAFENAHGMSFFAHMRSDDKTAAAFDASMALGASGRAGALLEALGDRPVSGRLVDVGGGSGKLVERLVSTYPLLRATVCDLKETITRATANWTESALRPRVDFVAGDFFEAVPDGADAYVLSFIIHDWDDARSDAILRNCRRAMTASASRLFIIEHVAEPGAKGDRWELYKLDLLEMLGSGLRTEEQIHTLVRNAGLNPARTYRTTSGFTVIEARVNE